MCDNLDDPDYTTSAAASQWECPACGKRTYRFLHSCSGVRQPHPNIILEPAMNREVGGER